MKKVIIEITGSGWTTTVKDNGNEIVEKHLSTPTGSRCVQGDFEEEESIDEELYDALNGFQMYDIMCALQ